MSGLDGSGRRPWGHSHVHVQAVRRVGAIGRQVVAPELGALLVMAFLHDALGARIGSAEDAVAFREGNVDVLARALGLVAPAARAELGLVLEEFLQGSPLVVVPLRFELGYLLPRFGRVDADADALFVAGVGAGSRFPAEEPFAADSEAEGEATAFNLPWEVDKSARS